MSGTQGRASIDKLLTNVSNQLLPEGYISESILISQNVKQYSGKIAKYGNEHLRIVNSIQSGKAGYSMVQSVKRDSDLYHIESHGLKDLVTNEDFMNVDKPFDAEKDVVIALTTHLWLGKEKALADTMGDVAVITNNVTLAGVTQYSAPSTSDPLGDFITARTTIRGACGMTPDSAFMDYDVAQHLRFHPALLDSLGFKDNRPGGLTDQELARALSVDRLLIAKAVFNNSKLGQADSIEPVWGKNLWFARLGKSAALRQRVLGYRFQLSGRKPRQVFKSSPDEPVNSKKIIVLDDYDQVLTNATCAYLIKDAIA